MPTPPDYARRPRAPVIPILILLTATGFSPSCSTFRASSPSAPLQSGQPAPNFSLRDAQPNAPATPITLAHLLHNGPVVLIFNMGPHCPACAGELAAFAARIQDFQAANIQIAAISDEDPADTREDLKSLAPLPFPLLYDPDNTAARAYGLVSPDGDTEERTFSIDQTRHIRDAYKPDQPGGEIPRLLALNSHADVPRTHNHK